MSLLRSILWIGLLVSSAWAQEGFRPAQSEDIQGRWQMVFQGIRPDMPKDLILFAPYQLFEFTNEGYMRNYATDKPLDNMSVMIFDNIPLNTTYAFPQAGILNVVRSKKDSTQISISYVTQSRLGTEPKYLERLEQGDLVLTYFDPKKQPYMQHHLRKWTQLQKA